jgi:hypothetical protein
MLSTDPVEEISAPVLDALVEVLPRILKQRYAVAYNLPTILDAHRKISSLKEAGLDVGEALRLLPEWGRLPDRERGAIRELAAEAQRSGRSALQILQDKLDEIDCEDRRLQSERKALIRARVEDPEKGALRAQVCELKETLEQLKASRDILSTRTEWMGEIIRGCTRCSERVVYLSLNNEEFRSKYSKDPKIAQLIGLRNK